MKPDYFDQKLQELNSITSDADKKSFLESFYDEVFAEGLKCEDE